jgi:hypothetical protein
LLFFNTFFHPTNTYKFLVIYEESGVDIEQLWEIIKLEVTDKDYPVETAFFFAWIKRNIPSNKAVAVFVQNGRERRRRR